jgi:hypothetical protein
MIGPGKYDHLCSFVRQSVMADGVVLIILNGDQGEGFSAQFKSKTLAAAMPDVLRQVADQIEADNRTEVTHG